MTTKKNNTQIQILEIIRELESIPTEELDDDAIEHIETAVEALDYVYQGTK